MAVGFGLLRLSAKDFWSLTPREIERAMSVFGLGAGGAPDREALAALMLAFPDEKR